jgi:DNA-binding beta-propeller fold protein YncE
VRHKRIEAVTMAKNVWLVVFALCVLAVIGTRLSAGPLYSIVPNGWSIEAPRGMITETDTMPQGAAASPNGRTLAVVEAGVNPPTLRLYSTADLSQTASISLTDAAGRPVWIDGSHVLVAGANADALLNVDVARQTVQKIPLAKHSYPSAVASANGLVAVATDGDLSVRIGTLETLADATATRIGGHIGGLAFTPDGKTLFASNRSSHEVEAIDTHTLARRAIDTALHPSDILPVGGDIYVAESDADSVGLYDAANGQRLARLFVGDASRGLAGVSPNALARHNDTIFVSLAAANSVAVIRDRRVVGRMPAGWYPTDVVPIGERLFIINGKGERTRPNPHFNPKNPKSNYDYIGSIEYGSIRTYDLARYGAASGNPQGDPGWAASQFGPVVRKGGPIRHVFFILKENRSYDQVLGDIPEGNGDPKLTWFGARVTPNEHALAERFGLFDNAYTSGEVSVPGHDWSDAGFVTDYVERTWPATYGDRGNGDESLPAADAVIPRNGYIWQAARAAHVSFRDYGELTSVPKVAFATLAGAYDLKYVSWNLNYSDVDRVKEWRREFDAFVRNGNLPQLEYIWLPNDHTAGSAAGKWTPVACVAQNDYALGLIVEAISHSPIWKSSAIFVIEDDSQDGPDHVSDQRTTMFLISPYARGGLQHAHYSTVSILRTMELILGLPALSTYDGMARPLDAAFTSVPRLQPYDAISPKVNINVRNGKAAYGSQVSAGMNFRRPDANPPGVLRAIIAHNHGE